MAEFGNIVLYIIMGCAVLGALSAIRNDESGLGKEFIEGLYSIGPIFVPVAGIMAATPYLSLFVKTIFGPVFNAIGADPSIAATTFIAVDMGGYQLAYALAATKEGWIMAMVTGYMAGATIVFSIPVGLAMLNKKDHKYMALGIMSGILTVPIGVLVSSLLIALSKVRVRDIISTDVESTYRLLLSVNQIALNIIPLVIICCLIAFGLRKIPDKMINGFIWFGRIIDACIKLVLVFSIVEYFTGFFSKVFGEWGFNPIIADTKDQFRALEIAGYIGIMLAGAFPMVYLMKKYLAEPLEVFGRRFGFSKEGSAGILAASANILAMLRLIEFMNAKDKVKCIAFAVCAAFLFGDHLAFTANFQPNLILPVMVGKLSAGILAIMVAKWLSVPKAIELESVESNLEVK